MGAPGAPGAEEEREAVALDAAGELGLGGAAAVPARAILHGIGRRGVGDGWRSLCHFLCDFLCAHLSSWDKPGRRAKGSLQRAATGKNG